MKDANGENARGKSPFPTPGTLPAFPDAYRVKPKGQGKRRRARWESGRDVIFEWDSLHGTLEKYNKRGEHLGEYDPITGDQISGPNPSYRIEP